jgi:hypothetical protein
MPRTGISRLKRSGCVKTRFLINSGSDYTSNPRAQIRLYD